MRYGLLIATLLPLGGAWADDSKLGRLFFTPAERQQMELIRQGGPAAQQTIESSPIEAIKPTPPDNVTLSGIIKREQGLPTIWINGKRYTGSNEGYDISATPLTAQTVVIALPDGRRARLKVGQTLDTGSETIKDAYQPQIKTLK
ncbi:hypothetical protein [Parachitinimonas caeni]|uniref:Uncharacterized protein n=1 Tax=Parachitinimonas caeni TaxID=3031301 RepID=A0ABT7DSY1_9NEIS|nr:hypothetical protein [Parachitinimonas caeni]MDK2123170.1 hypothetical protein [Parachitinimonas caeni]